MVKYQSLTLGLPLILLSLSRIDDGGMRQVAVKCIDMSQNTDSVGSCRGHLLTLRNESVGIKQD